MANNSTYGRASHTRENKKQPKLIDAAQVNVLIACEESQAECQAFRMLGFNAFSCDIQPCQRHGNPAWHIWGDVTPYLNGTTGFVTMDGKLQLLDKWHLIIAHPPCTYLCKVGSIHMYNPDGTVHWPRLRQMILGRRFFFQCLNAKADFLAVENPIPMKRAQLPPPSAFASPHWFGVKYSKKTLYWLKNLPPLMPTVTFPNPRCFVHCSRGKYRSRTFPQMAKAIAKQWGSFVLENMPG